MPPPGFTFWKKTAEYCLSFIQTATFITDNAGIRAFVLTFDAPQFKNLRKRLIKDKGVFNSWETFDKPISPACETDLTVSRLEELAQFPANKNARTRKRTKSLAKSYAAPANRDLHSLKPGFRASQLERTAKCVYNVFVMTRICGTRRLSYHCPNN